MSRRFGWRAAAGAVISLLMSAGCTGENPSLSASIDVFAAASLTDAFNELASEFESESPEARVRLNFAGSDALANQLMEGAPADVFASADSLTMDQVREAGVVGHPMAFARNRLVLAVAEGNPGSVTGIADLGNDELITVICAPEVPCGRATQRMLEQSAVSVRADSLEPNVRAVLGKLALGEADAGFVYHTDLSSLAGSEVEMIDLPRDLAAWVDLEIAPTTASSRPEMAAEFVDFVLSSRGREILISHAFDVAT